MSDGHVRGTRLDNGRRTKKPGIATRRGRGRRLWLWLVLFILPVAVIIPAVWVVAFGPHRDDMEKAIRYAERAEAERDPLFVLVARLWPEYGRIRQDPRFKAIVDRLHLPDYRAP